MTLFYRISRNRIGRYHQQIIRIDQDQLRIPDFPQWGNGADLCFRNMAPEKLIFRISLMT